MGRSNKFSRIGVTKAVKETLRQKKAESKAANGAAVAKKEWRGKKTIAVHVSKDSTKSTQKYVTAGMTDFVDMMNGKIKKVQ